MPTKTDTLFLFFWSRDLSQSLGLKSHELIPHLLYCSVSTLHCYSSQALSNLGQRQQKKVTLNISALDSPRPAKLQTNTERNVNLNGNEVINTKKNTFH